MQIAPVPATASATSAAPGSQEAKIRETARDFEALLIAQILNSFRGENDDDPLGGGSSSSTMMEFAGQHLAEVMSRQGGLGLHDLIVQGLLRKEESAAITQTGDRIGISAPAGQSSLRQVPRGARP